MINLKNAFPLMYIGGRGEGLVRTPINVSGHSAAEYIEQKKHIYLMNIFHLFFLSGKHQHCLCLLVWDLKLSDLIKRTKERNDDPIYCSAAPHVNIRVLGYFLNIFSTALGGYTQFLQKIKCATFSHSSTQINRL